NERFYIFFFFLAALVPFLILKFASARRGFFAAAAIGLPVLTYFIAHRAADTIIKGDVTYLRLFPDFFLLLSDYRSAYMNYPDVTAVNASLPYPLAFLKILLTPFFTLNKFALFSDYSYILIWGSFFTQAVILLSVYGMGISLKSDRASNWFLALPFLLFLLMFAYIAPYNGRLRDSFFPFLAVYAAGGYFSFLGRRKSPSDAAEGGLPV
ncbi:MAG TPA: hypothetical protein PK523_06930, partial [Elusimicrobiales bacterium]|nr:hypothetical protein [Elusimicrobiales bacterium]